MHYPLYPEQEEKHHRRGRNYLIQAEKVEERRILNSKGSKKAWPEIRLLFLGVSLGNGAEKNRAKLKTFWTV
jgi:hypothetical protein